MGVLTAVLSGVEILETPARPESKMLTPFAGLLVPSHRPITPEAQIDGRSLTGIGTALAWHCRYAAATNTTYKTSVLLSFMVED